MKIVFDREAISDLQAIRDWIAQDSPRRAIKILRRIRYAVSVLDRFPKRGRPGRRLGTRELIVPRLPYLIIYEMRHATGEVVITAVVHMARDRSKMD